MDYKTAVESYIELKKEGQYKVEAVELLADEVIQSEVICETDKLILEQLLENIRHAKRFGDSEPVEEIYKTLSKYAGFRTHLAKVLTDFMQGERKR